MTWGGHCVGYFFESEAEEQQCIFKENNNKNRNRFGLDWTLQAQPCHLINMLIKTVMLDRLALLMTI